MPKKTTKKIGRRHKHYHQRKRDPRFIPPNTDHPTTTTTTDDDRATPFTELAPPTTNHPNTTTTSIDDDTATPFTELAPPTTDHPNTTTTTNDDTATLFTDLALPTTDTPNMTSTSNDDDRATPVTDLDPTTTYTPNMTSTDDDRATPSTDVPTENLNNVKPVPAQSIFNTLCTQIRKEEIPGFLTSVREGLITFTKQYPGENPGTMLTVSIDNSWQVALYVHRIKVGPDHAVFAGLPQKLDTLINVKTFLGNLNRLTVCVGNPDEDFQHMVPVHAASMSHGTKMAYREEDFGAVCGNLSYSSTIRSAHCFLLVEGARCKKCSLYRSSLRKKRCEEKKKTTNDIDYTKSPFPMMPRKARKKVGRIRKHTQKHYLKAKQAAADLQQSQGEKLQEPGKGQKEENEIKQEAAVKSVSKACGSQAHREASLAQEPQNLDEDDPKVPTATRAVRERTKIKQSKGVTSVDDTLESSPPRKKLRNDVLTPKPQEHNSDETGEQNRDEPQEVSRIDPKVTGGIEGAMARSSVTTSRELVREASSLLTRIEHNYARNWETHDRGPLPVIVVEKRPNQGPLPVFLIQNKYMGEGAAGVENSMSSSGVKSQTHRQEGLSTSNTDNITYSFNSLSTAGSQHFPCTGDTVKTSCKDIPASSTVDRVDTRVRMKTDSYVREELCEFYHTLNLHDDDPKVLTDTQVPIDRTDERLPKGLSGIDDLVETSSPLKKPRSDASTPKPQEENGDEPQGPNRDDPKVTSGMQVAVASSVNVPRDLTSDASSLLTKTEHDCARNWEINDRGPVPVIVVEKRPNQGPLPVFLIQNKHMGEGSIGVENPTSISGVKSQRNRQEVLRTSNTDNIPNPFNSLSAVGSQHSQCLADTVKTSGKYTPANSTVDCVDTRVRMEAESHVREEGCEFETIECETSEPVPYGPHYPQEYLDLGNKLRTTTLPGNFETPKKSWVIYITDYQTKGPHIVIRISVTITLNFEAKVAVHQTLLPSDHEFWKGLPTKYDTVSAITALLKKLSCCKVCEGNDDKQFLDHYSSTSRNRSNRTNQTEPAYRDTNVMYDTLRSVKCQWLHNLGSRCNKCNGYRVILRKAVSRQNHIRSPNKNTPLILMSHDELCKKVKAKDQELKRLSAHASELETALKLYVGRDVNVSEDGLTGKQSGSHIMTAVELTPNSLEEQPVPVGESFSVLSPEGSTYHSDVPSPEGSTRHSSVMSPEDTTHHSGVLSPWGTTHHSGVLSPGGTTHHSGVLSPGGTTHHSGVLSPGGTTHHSGVQSPGGTTHHSGVQSPGGTTHHSGVQSPGGSTLHSGNLSLSKEDTCLDDTSSGPSNDVDGHKSESMSMAKGAPGKSLRGKASYRCHICGRKFIKLVSFVIHIKSKTCTKTFNCDLCSQTFHNVRDLYSHKKTHTQYKRRPIHAGERPFQCQTCGKTYITQQDLREHEQNHTIDPTSEKSLACEICGQKFHLQKQLSSHKSKKHKERKIRKCEVCGKEFLSTIGLIKHTRIHTGEKPFLCAVCGKSFRTFAHFHRHRRTHTGEKPYKCDDCGKAFSNPTGYKSHLATHTGENLFDCSTCGKKLTTKRGLTQHERIHTGERPHPCDVCGKGFIQLGTLKTHMLIHTGVSHYKYTCNVCWKGFLWPHELKVHSVKQSGERPWQCDVCGKGFARALSLENHKRLHTGERPYKCTVCGKRYTCLSNLSTHKGRQHPHIADKAQNE